MSKTHARDFLLEMAGSANTAGWMHDLIIRVVASNGQLTEEDLVATASQLKANAPAVLTNEVRCRNDETTKIVFTELIHHSGVNALACEQKIPFSKDITLLYGCNGAGKSSYFRVLNEMVGGNREIRIHQNIFAQTPAPINVELKYTENGTPRSVSWNGTGRAFAPLTQASVFDSGYTNDLLEKRSADTAIVKPLGLHLFAALTSAMDSVKDRLASEIGIIERSLPHISQDNLAQERRSLLNGRDYSPEQKEYIVTRYAMSSETHKALKDCETEYEELMKTNYDDKIKLTQGEKSLVSGLKNHLDNCQGQLKEAAQTATVLYAKLASARIAQEEAKRKIQILEEIGNTDSKEWQVFIQSGASYVANSTMTSGICPYCRQPLLGQAVNIVKAYSDFLSDTTAATYEDLIKEKNELLLSISNVVTKYTLSEQLLQVLAAQENGEELKVYVADSLNRLEDTKNALLVSFEKEQYESLGFPEGSGALGKVVTKYDEVLAQLNTAKDGKEDRLGKLNETRMALLEHKTITEQHELWEQWFAKVEQIRELERCQGKLSTRAVSMLSRIASQELLTESLRAKFEEELCALKLGYLEVSLEEEGASRGQPYMIIKLPSSIKTQEILSEGEQKGVALALFIAERRMEQVKNPIILDDPVNSLDHHITALLMERLVSLGNQVIIFSHHILLRDSLLALHAVHECSAKQMISCQKQSKHLFLYNVTARDAKGYILGSRQDNARNYIVEAQRVLGDPNFDGANDIGRCSGLLRQAIEHMVDEKVFKDLVPVKYRGGKNQTIKWDKLKELQADPTLIDMLQNDYNRLSGGDLHLGGESRENPIEWAELNQMCVRLLAVA